jgi:hypothetical protein
VHLPYPNYSGILSTGGGLVFLALYDGTIAAFDDTTLEQLWKIKWGSGFSAPPMTYEFNGRQYVAIASGASNTAITYAPQPAIAGTRGNAAGDRAVRAVRTAPERPGEFLLWVKTRLAHQRPDVSFRRMRTCSARGLSMGGWRVQSTAIEFPPFRLLPPGNPRRARIGGALPKSVLQAVDHARHT